MSTIELDKIRLGELDAWHIQHDKWQATILAQGAQLIEFSTHTQQNWLWLSEQAVFKRGQAVRGGIPICWPIFGAFAANPQAVQASFAQALPQHGLARVSHWVLQNMTADNDEAKLTFGLDDWADGGQDLSLVVTFLFSPTQLSVELTTKNIGHDSKTITQALHTYLPTDDINHTSIAGFANTFYTDKVESSTAKIQQEGDITFSSETDRIYHASPNILITTPNQRVQIVSSGSQSTVVWNPWIDKAKQTSQMQADDYLSMLCVETANVLDDAVTLKPNAQHSLALTMIRKNNEG